MITLAEIEQKLQILRERYKVELCNQEIIKRQARGLNIAKEMILKRTNGRPPLL